MGDDELETGAVGKPMTGMEVKIINWEEGNYRVTDRPSPRGEGEASMSTSLSHFSLL